ncbi:MAG: putative Zinc finger protein ZPR1 [Streblomastix strix]|uniref:Putative Zinc finger protein ZPR1 n=1 Tax=Streblomastix strix TaxID=222440 RepID=A0A5J4UGT7_9EUKA|nr:MAG: putative Zinc finger protein ZPR1 [Streblomastix strix]
MTQQATPLDPKCKSRSYTRSREQCEIIGLSVPPYEENSDEKEKENNQELSQNEKETNKDQFKSGFNIAHLSKIQLSTIESQVLKVASPEDIVEMVLPCSCCSNEQGIMRTITASIPLFKQIVLMAYSCEQCGYRNCEVTPAGEISQKGKKYSLTVTRKEDLNRDVLKSDSAFLIIPQLGFEMATGTLGGVFTTVEGILVKAKERLEQVSFVGDSATKTEKNKFSAFIQAIDSMSKMSEGPFTIILNDPLGNSYIQDLFYPNPDPYLFVEEYIRTSEQNEELGLNDMKIEGYEEDEGKQDQQE